ncbi:FecR family protein [Methylophilus rhizosphaerae]|uniref:FecR family protein n=1 Tax=Methylophilus rhizosphaerae TaxID=492660 RepID=A0A1G9BN44_9PROT|nr:FecR domain-containing protein [Methylophilus rhizosphaerae]SDK40931.1 FecR family protein [Methylophilus rhizosphaerae]
MTPEQRIFNQAAEWFAILQDDNMSKADYQSWQTWLAEDPAHALVWQRVETLSQPFQTLAGTVPANLARETLGQIHNAGRRRALRLLGIGGTAIAASWLLRGLPWQAWRYEYAIAHAAYRTGVGERQQFKLTDGTVLMLNTASAVDVDYGQDFRRIVLHQGEIHVESAHDIQARPLVVDTSVARITALGTRFTVRSDRKSGHVAVFDGAVSVLPEKSAAMRVDAGQQVRFTKCKVIADGVADLAREAWSAGKIVADNIALQDFIHELGRYTAVSIQVSPAVAHLRLVGVYSIANPVSDVPVILAALEHALPVRIQQASPTQLTIISQ